MRSGLQKDQVRLLFFDTNVSQILKAIDGSSYLGAFTLILCSAAALSSLENSSDSRYAKAKDGDSYRRWFDTWMTDNKRTERPRYPAAYMYGVRCSLVHTYGGSSALNKLGKPSYVLTTDEPERHLKPHQIGAAEPGFILNLENLLVDFIAAAWDFWTTITPSAGQQSEFEKQCSSLVSLVNSSNPTSKIILNRSYAELHPALSTFDSHSPRYDDIFQAIHDVYKTNKTCRCDF